MPLILYVQAHDIPAAAKMIKGMTSSPSASGMPTVSKEKTPYKPIKAERPSDLAIQNYRKAQQLGRGEILSNGILAGPSIVPPVPLQAQPKPMPSETEHGSSSSEESSSDDGNGMFISVQNTIPVHPCSLWCQMTCAGWVLLPRGLRKQSVVK